MKIGNHETHELADAFPLMGEDALLGLIEDIEANGQRRPIKTVFGQILDGRNRYIACVRLGIEPILEDYDGPTGLNDLARYVISENMARRDLDAGQRALCSRRLLKLCRTVRKQRAAGQTEMVQDLEGASEQLLEDGTAELIAAVDRGDIPLSVAVEVSKREPDEQKLAVEALLKPEPVKPQRAKVDGPAMMSRAEQLTPMDIAAAQVGYRVLSKSVHAEARACAALIKRLVPGVKA